MKKRGRKLQKRIGLFAGLLLAAYLPVFVSFAQASQQEYAVYKERLDSVGKKSDIPAQGFSILEGQTFPVLLENFREVTFLPALDEKYHRLVLFFEDEEGNIVYKTDQLEANFIKRGELAQPISGLRAVSFQDVNGDMLTDIVLITSCYNEEQEGMRFKVGDVLFQKEEGFFRDWRISDKLNRFGMNGSVDFITAYVRDGKSTEYLYTASTLKELQRHGFTIFNEQCYTRDFEKMGKLQVVPGRMTIADYDVFMIYLVNEQGTIVWRFQPMADYDNLYALRGINCRDIDGDGMKDIVVLARYSSADEQGQLQIRSDFEIYYQRTGGFTTEADFKKSFSCDETTKMEDLVREARAYWGWKAE